MKVNVSNSVIDIDFYSLYLMVKVDIMQIKPSVEKDEEMEISNINIAKLVVVKLMHNYLVKAVVKTDDEDVHTV